MITLVLLKTKQLLMLSSDGLARAALILLDDTLPHQNALYRA
jgi:hypothetical protein